jgi:hypothetical protein
LIEEEHNETMRGRFLPSVHIALSSISPESVQSSLVSDFR